MKLKLVPARQGALWVRQGLRTFFQRPMSFTLLFLIYLFVAPWLLVVTPLASLGFMIATQRALAGRIPQPDVFIEPLRAGRDRAWAQLRLGLAYAAAAASLLWLFNQVGGTELQAASEVMMKGSSPEDANRAFSGANVQAAAWLLLIGLALLSVPFWHAPALVHWGRMPAMKAVFFSVVACWRNKGAMLVYALGWAAVSMLFAVVSTLVAALLGAPQAAFAAMFGAMLVLSSAFFASLYFTFTDSFEPADPQQPALPDSPGTTT